MGSGSLEPAFASGVPSNIAPVPAFNALPLPLFRRARKLLYGVKKIRNLNLILLRRLFSTKEVAGYSFVRTNVHFGCE
jgi:hypothetical protein